MRFTILTIAAASLLLTIIGLNSKAHSGVITYESDTPVYNNCIPFGCNLNAFMGFAYDNIDAMSLNAGDTIGFDLTNGEQSFSDLTLYIGATDASEPNGLIGDFVKFGSIYGMTGDNTIGNYETIFTMTNTFDFAGGGLVFIFEKGVDHAPTNLQQGASLNNGDGSTFLGRFFPGSLSLVNFDRYDAVAIPNFQVNVSAVPAPATIAIFALGLLGFSTRRVKKLF